MFLGTTSILELQRDYLEATTRESTNGRLRWGKRAFCVIWKQLSEKENIDGVTQKLDGLAKLLDLYPYDSDGQFQGKIKAVSYKSIKAAQVICPISITCETTSCNPRSLLQNTRLRDIPRATLIKGSEIYKNVQVLTGHCPSCQTTYLADHERVLQEGKTYQSLSQFCQVS